MKHYGYVFSRALRQFGSWTEALIAAGIVRKGLANKLYSSPLVILRALRDALESHSKDNIPPTLRSQAELYFGSLRKTIVVLKKDRRFLRGWSTLKIIKVLAQMHRSKKDLTYAAARRTVPALVSAAEGYFGSWGGALYAAGIDPNLYFVHHRWRRTVTHGQR